MALKRKKLAAAVTAAVGFTLLSSPGYAADSWVLEEIIVSAQKDDRMLNDVGIAVTAMSDKDLENFRVGEATDLAQFTPNVDISSTLSGANPAVTIRGVGLNDYNANNNPTVGVYVDDVFQASPAMLDAMMFDTQRVEILKGPQGLLFGRNSNGGAINIITRRPTEETEGSIKVGYGNYETIEVETVLSGPLSQDDTVLGRLSVKYDDQGESHHDNIVTGDDFGSFEKIAARAQVQLAPASGDYDVNFALSYAEADGTATPFSTVGVLDSGFAPCAASAKTPLDPSGIGCESVFTLLFGVPADQTGDNDGDPYRHAFDESAADLYRLESDTLSFTVTFNRYFENFDMVSITNYTAMDRIMGDNVNSVPIPEISSIIRDEEVSQISQELRFSGSISDADWIAGVYYSTDEIITDNVINSENFFGTDLVWDIDQSTTSYAAFSHIEYMLTDTVSFVGGLRYTVEETEFKGGTTDLDPNGTTLIFPGQLTYVDDKIDDEAASYKVGLEYRPNPDTMTYASYTTGFKSGGFFGDFTFDQLELEPFDKEELASFEVGIKQTLLDGTMQINAAAFHYDYDDIQTFVPGVAALTFTNADEATIDGADLELSWRPVNGLDVRMGVGYIDSELDDDNIPGDTLPNSSQWQYNGMLRYEFDLSADIMMALQTDFKYSDNMYRDAFNDPIAESDDYMIINVRISVYQADNDWDLSAWVKNLEDEVYTTQAFNFSQSFGTGVANYSVGAPRTFGVTAAYNF